MPLFSVGDALDLIGRKLGGSGVDVTCEPGRSQAVAAYNTINRLLMLEQETFVDAFVQIPVSQGCFTLDRRIQRILEAKSACTTIPVVGPSFKFLDSVQWSNCRGCACLDQIEFVGSDFALARDLDRPRVLFAVSDRPEAAGAALHVIGADEAGADLRTFGGGLGISVPIVYATCEQAPEIACGDGYHRGQVSAVRMLRKPRTNGYVQLWGLDELNGDVYWLATLGPDETSPAYTRYRANGCGGHVNLHVTLQYAPLYDVNEVSLIQQPDAYEFMTQALHYRDTGDLGGYQSFRNTALSLVRKDIKRKDGTTHGLNVQVGVMPLQGRHFSMRGNYRFRR